MKNKVSIVLITALLWVGVVLFSACNKDKNDADAKTIAKELCDCFTKAKDVDEAWKCEERLWVYEDREDAFWDAIDKELEDCKAMWDWYTQF